jgi:hypothetical protein
MQGAPAEPGHDERPFLGQRAIHLRGGEPGSPRPQRQPRRTEVLGLDRQQTPDDRLRGQAIAPGEELTRGPAAPELPRSRRRALHPRRIADAACTTRCSRGARLFPAQPSFAVCPVRTRALAGGFRPRGDLALRTHVPCREPQRARPSSRRTRARRGRRGPGVRGGAGTGRSAAPPPACGRAGAPVPAPGHGLGGGRVLPRPADAPSRPRGGSCAEVNRRRPTLPGP